jgi:hypothetical protein
MLIERYHKALGKSNHGGQSLYDHIFWSIEAGLRTAQLVGIHEGPQLDVMLMGIGIHDVGKLDPDFQAMLQASRDGRDLPPKRVKHEASTLDYDHPTLVENSLTALRDEIRAYTGYTVDLDNVAARMDDVWTCAVTHHGLFYLSFEDWGEGSRPLIRRYWTSLYPNEVRRITLVDLLVDYHPIGGLVMLGDLMASYAFEQERDLAWAFAGVETLPDVFARLLKEAEELETEIQAYDPRNYALRETLTLLAGGCSLAIVAEKGDDNDKR